MMMPSRGLLFVLMQRLWQALGGVVTIFFIAHTLSPDMQGWFYTFVSVASLYTLFEMGLSAALIQVTAQLFIKVHWMSQGGFAGQNAEIFLSFFLNTIKTYFKFTCAFLGLAFVVGYFIFIQKGGLVIEGREWTLPWIALLIGTAMNMMMLPFFAVVEGSGEVSEVYAIRLLQGFLGSIFCWFVLLNGGDLWAASMMPILGAVVSFLWLYKKRPQLLHLVLSKHTSKKFNWSKEVWPLQWRIGLNWVSLFLMSQLCTPILFYYQNSNVAGQMGLSLTIAHMLGLLSQSWITRRVPYMSQAAAKKEWHLLDDLFKKDFMRSMIVFIFGAILLLIGHKIISQSIYVNRMLDFWPFLGLLLFSFFYYVNIALAIQLRSYRKEPLVWVALLGGLLILIATAIAAKDYSVNEVVLVMVTTQMLLITPLSIYIWRNRNRQYRLNS
jgi:O-antigen/teichoic acid export membrane protein